VIGHYKETVLCEVQTNSAEETGASPYKLLGPGSPEWGPGPEYISYVFVFLGSIINCRLCQLILSFQTQDDLQLTVNISGLV
jgi:hypothetical protein